MKLIRSGVAVTLALGIAFATTEAQSAKLQIVVIAGEGGVNIIQQNSAVAPIVEVRDENGQPVAGAVVTFAVRGGRATFSGARTLTVTTDVAGRAAGAGLTPTAAGAVQIGASATSQGLVATATIVQTNFLTAAAATAAVAGGGGILGASATTLGIIGGAAVGGTLAAKQVLGGSGPSIYEGEFRIDGVETIRDTQSNGTVSFACAATLSFTGEVRAEVDDLEDGTMTGTVSANGFVAQLSSTCPFSSATNEHLGFGSGDVTGTTTSFQVSSATAEGVGFGTLAFVGALNDGAITGTFTLSSGYRFPPDNTGKTREALFPATGTQVRLTK